MATLKGFKRFEGLKGDSNLIDWDSIDRFFCVTMDAVSWVYLAILSIQHQRKHKVHDLYTHEAEGYNSNNQEVIVDEVLQFC